jgi:hypothetical protein
MVVGDIQYDNKLHRRRIYHACIDCGIERWVDFKKGQPVSLRCRHCAGLFRRGLYKNEEAFAFKDGRRDSQGYIQILLKQDDFFSSMTNKAGYVMEHRLIMAKSLGRCLQPWEVVHHINSIRSDNHIKNLQLVTELGNRQIYYFERKLSTVEFENKQLKNRVKILESRITILEAEYIISDNTKQEAYKND